MSVRGVIFGFARDAEPPKRHKTLGDEGGHHDFSDLALVTNPEGVFEIYGPLQ